MTDLPPNSRPWYIATMNSTDKIETKILAVGWRLNSDAPYADDALGREDLCKRWTRFIERSTTPYVMAIDGKWGTGKTTLLRMWEADLRKADFRCVFFDAWEADFYGHALPALIGEITKQIPDEEFNSKMKELSGVLFASATLHAISLMLPGGNIAAEIAGAWEQSLKDHDAVEAYRSYREAVDKFKKTLQKFASCEKNGKPLVIFVDELDRCRPDFALEVLEKVKHVFDVESVFFVFAINKDEMRKTIQTVYGDIDSECYLRKFFDHTFLLINKSGLGETAFAKSGLKSHIEERIKWLQANGLEVEDELRSFQQLLHAMISRFPLSLRDEEQILVALNVSFREIRNDLSTFPLVLAYFILLKVANRGLYEQCKAHFYSDGKTPFPYKEVTNFYRTAAGFGKSEPIAGITAPETRDDWRIYRNICAVCYRASDEYRTKVNSLFNTSGEETSRFWKDVDMLAHRSFDSGVPSDYSKFFETLDSIGGFSFDSSRKLA